MEHLTSGSHTFKVMYGANQMTTADMIQELGNRITRMLVTTDVDKQWEGEIHKLHVARAALLDLAGTEA